MDQKEGRGDPRTDTGNDRDDTLRAESLERVAQSGTSRRRAEAIREQRDGSGKGEEENNAGSDIAGAEVGSPRPAK